MGLWVGAGDVGVIDAAVGSLTGGTGAHILPSSFGARLSLLFGKRCCFENGVVRVEAMEAD